jgi:hypothetical protein
VHDDRAAGASRSAWARSAATRYLCFGAQTDEEFAQRVVHELVRTRWRAVAPSYGIDAVPIVHHCLWALRRHALRDLALTLLFAAEASSGLLFFLGLVFRDRTATPADVLRRSMTLLVALAVTVLIAGGVRMADWAWGRLVIGRRLVAERFDPQARRLRLLPWTSRRVDAIQRQQYGLVTVYDAESPTPFVGAGPEIAHCRWSFAIDLRRQAEDPFKSPREIDPFRPLDLYGHVESHLDPLRGSGVTDAYLLPGLEIADHLFVSGLTVRNGVSVLDHVEGQKLTPDELRQIADVPAGLIRHFKRIQVESWDGELVVTAFLHVATQGSTLYVEFIPCLLPPIRSRYHDLDIWPLPPVREWVAEAADGWLGAQAAMITAPGRLLRRRLDDEDVRPEGWRAWGLPRDRGARTSVRLLAALREPRHHFQWLDARKYLRVIEVQVLNSIVEFLDCRGIDTSDVRARRTAIFNQGVIIKDSTVQGTAIAAGDGAEASVTKPAASPPPSQPPPANPPGGAS